MRKYGLIVCLLLTGTVQADGSGVDKVYHPYVQQLEREVEWRMTSIENEQLHRFGLGTAISDRWYIETSLLARDGEQSGLTIEQYELELKYQLTEQGEYDYDWGIVTELEKSRSDHDWEWATGLLIEREWGRYIGAANLWVKYEWGQTVDSEFETAVALQARYRYSRQFEPAIEAYLAEDTRAIGPVFLGDVVLEGRKNLHWEAGVLWGVDSVTPDTLFRFLAEFEF